VVDILNLNLNWSIQLTFVGFITLATTYAIALFGFHIFDPVAIAHKIVIEQMQKGMLVIDRDEKIIDMNPVAEKILALSKAEASGKKVDEVLARSIWGNGENQQTEIRILVDKALHYFELNHTPILDKHGSLQGQLILLHDVTFQKLVQKQILEQQRALGSLEERRHLARELHDQLAQELAFINLQAQAACSMLESNQTTQAKAAILHLAEIARQTQIDVRELISFLIEPGSTDGSFLATIHQTVVRFNQECGIKVQLHLPSDSLLKLDPVVEVQLLRIIQEGLTNIRKHANAQQVQLTITPSLNQFDVVIEDDGVGFDQDELASDGGGYGLNIMRDRAIAIDGDLQIVSAPGEGARICIRVPLGSDTIEG
jgi:PAS domain S-box-containing protein